MSQLVGCWTDNPRVGVRSPLMPCMAAIDKVTKASYPCCSNIVKSALIINNRKSPI